MKWFRAIRKQLAVAVMFCLGAAAQQSGALAKARQKLEEYRQSKMATWMNDFGELGRYRDANAALAAPVAGENRVVFMGDSITDGWPIPEYFPGKPYVNRGIGGQTTPQMLIRFRHDVIDLKPRAVVILLQAPMTSRQHTRLLTVGEVEANYASMAKLARANDIRVVFSSVIPVNNYTPLAEPFFLTRPPEEDCGAQRMVEGLLNGEWTCLSRLLRRYGG